MTTPALAQSHNSNPMFCKHFLFLSKLLNKIIIDHHPQDSKKTSTVSSPLTLVPSSIISAADAGAGPLVALVCMPVTLAGSAAREAPVTRLASVTALTECSRTALTLTGKLVTKSGHGAVQTATAGLTENRQRLQEDERVLEGHDGKRRGGGRKS